MADKVTRDGNYTLGTWTCFC